jgi:type VI secretion system protein ImpA
MNASKKPAAQKQTTERAERATRGTPIVHDWMAPIDTVSPCGADLEYDPEFVVLSSKAAARADAQYGDFVGSPEPVNWSEVDRDCRRLMMRSKDMRLAVLFTRCRTRLAAATGLAEGVALLAAWLAAFPDALHPQLGVDPDREAALEIRMNALQSLTDSDGLLADVREIALTKSTATRLQVRDVERAFAHPRPSDALAPESVARQLEDLRAQQPAVLAGFEQAHEGIVAIEAWSREHLGLYAPDLSALTRLLRHVAGQDGRRPVADTWVPVEEPQPAEESEPARESSLEDEVAAAASAMNVSQPRTMLSDRHAALDRIREARLWFEQNEPSSPIPVLLRRAEHFVGKRYAEVVKAIPAELLTQWAIEE